MDCGGAVMASNIAYQVQDFATRVDVKPTAWRQAGEAIGGLVGVVVKGCAFGGGFAVGLTIVSRWVG